MKSLLAQLTEAYRRRDTLWVELEEQLENSGITRDFA